MKAFAATALAAIALAFAAAGCNSDALPPASGVTNLTGTIVDAATNLPVAGAIVTIDTLLTATTDPSGKFTIAKVPSGIVDYTVQAKGYQTVDSTANVEPGKPFELDLALNQQQSVH